MDKTVKVTIMGPIPINVSTGALTRGTHGPMPMSEKDLFKCISSGAVVDEIIPGLPPIRLNFINYRTHNGNPSARDVTVPKPVDSSYINNGPIVRNNPVTIDRELSMAESKEDDMVETVSETESTNLVEQVDVDNESPRHWQAPPKEKRNKRH